MGKSEATNEKVLQQFSEQEKQYLALQKLAKRADVSDRNYIVAGETPL